MAFAQRRNRLTTHFSERIPVIKLCISVYSYTYRHTDPVQFVLHVILKPQGRSTTIHMAHVIITPDSERRYQVLADKEMLASSKMGWRHELWNTCPTLRQTSMCATARHLLHRTKKKPFQDADHNRMLIGDLGSQVPTSKRHIERFKRVF